MGVFSKFRRNKKDIGRTPTEEEVNASLNVEGDPNAKFQPIQQEQQQRHHLQHIETPQWSNIRKIDAEQGPATSYTKMADYGNEQNYELDYDEDEKPIYIVKQSRGYLSILFSLAQTVILIAMMVQCSVAPISINPMIGPYPDALSYWGGKNAYLILYDNEFWRLVSPIMLHAGVFHLICNIGVQLDTGAFWEREWGSFVWLTVYLVSAVWGSILSVIVIPNSIGVGSSGSVCGLFGAKMAEAFCRMCESRKSAQQKLSHEILCEQFGSVLCSVILILAFSFIPFVDWAAHVGGLIGGFTVGLLLFSCKVKTRTWRIFWFLSGLLMTGIGLAFGIFYMNREIKGNVAEEMQDVCAYYQEYFQGMGQDYECRCMLRDEK